MNSAKSLHTDWLVKEQLAITYPITETKLLNGCSTRVGQDYKITANIVGKSFFLETNRLQGTNTIFKMGGGGVLNIIQNLKRCFR